MKTKNFSTIFFIWFWFLTSCAAATPTISPSPTLDLTATAEEVSKRSAQATSTQELLETADAERAEATANAESTQSAVGTANAEATAQAAAEQQATETAIFQATETKATEIAAQEATKMAATAQAVAEATAQALPLADFAQTLYEQEVISRADGEYQVLGNFDASWAQINYYQWSPTGYRLADFILQADLTWESASDKANWWNSGCGYVFRLNEDGDHYLTFLGLDGNVYLYRNINSRVGRLGMWYAGPVDIPLGSATFTLVADGNWITFFVDGEQIHRRQDTSFAEGGLAYVLVSGTNKDFGTWCQWENVQLWELD